MLFLIKNAKDMINVGGLGERYPEKMLENYAKPYAFSCFLKQVLGKWLQEIFY